MQAYASLSKQTLHDNDYDYEYEYEYEYYILFLT